MNDTGTILTCGKCGTRIKVKTLNLKSVGCPKCTARISVKEARASHLKQMDEHNREERQTRRQMAASFLADNREADYTAIDPNSRDMIENEYATILAEGLNSWSDTERTIHVLLTQMNGRRDWMDNLWKAKVLLMLEAIADNQSYVQAGQAHLASSLNDIARKLGIIKVAAKVGGVWAAGELGKNLGESLDNTD